MFKMDSLKYILDIIKNIDKLQIGEIDENDIKEHITEGIDFLTNKNAVFSIEQLEEAMQTVASHAAQDCYGVVDLVSRRFSDNISQLLGKNQLGKGALVQTVDDLIYVELFVVLKLGVNIEAVKKSLADAVKFSLETFTGMRVKRVHVNVVGIRV